MSGALYFGDNLEVLRNQIERDSVDLVYLDPPFNSNANYNVLFKQKTGQPAEAQAEAFRDTWSWGESAQSAYADVMQHGGEVALVLSGIRKWLGENAMMAYLAMMSVRLIELRRVLRPNGSLYLHCDPTASHYLKLLLDAIFGHSGFLNELVWKRTSAHSSARRYGPVHDVILFYNKGADYVWNPIFQDYDKEYIEAFYTHVDQDGRRWRRSDLTGAGTRRGETGLSWRGIDITRKGRHWAYPPKELDKMDKKGQIHWPKKENGMPMLKRYLDEQPGMPLQDIFIDIPPMHNLSAERLGYPTQKPRALLERLISASSNPKQVILDPFCGCGTTIDAAEKLGRNWIGIDVTHYAITLIETRLKRIHPAAKYAVEGRPTDLAGARDLFRRDPHQFQWWAAWRLGAHSYREAKRGADRGIDGNIFFANGPYGTGRIIISVKGGENIGPLNVRELRGVIEREDAEMGLLVTLAKPTRAMEADAAAAGYVSKSAHGRLPRLQIVTIEDFLDGKLPKLPALAPRQQGAPTKRKASRAQMEMLLPLSSTQISLGKNDFLDPTLLKIGRR